MLLQTVTISASACSNYSYIEVTKIILKTENCHQTRLVVEKDKEESLRGSLYLMKRNTHSKGIISKSKKSFIIKYYYGYFFSRNCGALKVVAHSKQKPEQAA